MTLVRTVTIAAALLAVVVLALMAYGAWSIYTITDWVAYGSLGPDAPWEVPDTPRYHRVSGAIWIALFAHLPLLACAVFIVSKLPDTRRLGCLSIITGIISASFFFLDIGGLGELAKEILHGHVDESLHAFLLWGMLTHLVFLSVLGATLYRAWQCSDQPEPSTSSTEGLFVSMHIAGVLCAVCGSLLVLIVRPRGRSMTPLMMKHMTLVETAFVLAPYLLIAAAWLWFAYWRSDVLDEKQRSDTHRAGITAWLCSIPLMYILFIIQYRSDAVHVSNLWFPLYLFVTLFVFSVASLWYYNRE